MSNVEGPHNHSTNNDDKVMADIYRVLSRCQPVLCAFANIIFLIFTLPCVVLQMRKLTGEVKERPGWDVNAGLCVLCERAHKGREGGLEEEASRSPLWSPPLRVGSSVPGTSPAGLRPEPGEERLDKGAFTTFLPHRPAEAAFLAGRASAVPPSTPPTPAPSQRPRSVPPRPVLCRPHLQPLD